MFGMGAIRPFSSSRPGPMEITGGRAAEAVAAGAAMGAATLDFGDLYLQLMISRSPNQLSAIKCMKSDEKT